MIPLEQWRADGRPVAVGPHRIFLRDSGAATGRPALVLVHGFPTASWDYAAIWPLLERDFHLITLDLLGFGFSDKPRPHTYSIAEQADIVEAVLSHAGVGAHHLLAHDYGDTVAQELLARDNARSPAERRLLSLTLLNGGLFPETHRPRLVQRLLASPIGSLVSRAMNRRALSRSMRSIFGPGTPPSESELDGFWQLISEQQGGRIAHLLIRYMEERRRHRERWVGALTGANCPLALINGSADPISGAHMVARWREVVGKGHIVELPDIGHYPQVEAPDAVVRHLREFIGSLGA